jgi:hypothetical protein
MFISDWIAFNFRGYSVACAYFETRNYCRINLNKIPILVITLFLDLLAVYSYYSKGL